MKTYIFEIEIEHDPEDGIWEAEIPVLPGCAVWGYSKDETLEALREAAKAYLDVSLEYGDPLPRPMDGRRPAAIGPNLKPKGQENEDLRFRCRNRTG